MSRQLLARLKPYDEKKGHLLRTLTIPDLGIFRAETHDGRSRVYKVSEDVARRLDTYRQNQRNPESPRAFDIGYEDEIQGQIIAEQRKVLGVGPGALESSEPQPIERAVDSAKPAAKPVRKPR